MKKAINKTATQGLEILNRILFSFHVLIIGIAIPTLFFLGISTREDQKRSPEKEISGSAESAPAIVSSTIALPSIIEI